MTYFLKVLKLKKLKVGSANIQQLVIHWFRTKAKFYHLEGKGVFFSYPENLVLAICTILLCTNIFKIFAPPPKKIVHSKALLNKSNKSEVSINNYFF